MDDILLARNNIEYLISIKERLFFNFEMDMGETEFILMLKFSVTMQRECYLFLMSLILIKFWNNLT